jgi:hypothetical protein
MCFQRYLAKLLERDWGYVPPESQVYRNLGYKGFRV